MNKEIKKTARVIDKAIILTTKLAVNNPSSSIVSALSACHLSLDKLKYRVNTLKL